MSDPIEPAVIYLEPDDEITTVVRRLRETDAPRVVLVAPGRTKATTSAMGLRLLAGVAREEGRELVLVADPAARSLAAEAGIAATASVAEARGLRDLAADPTTAARSGARITVARGPRRAAPPPPPAPSTSFDETRPVAIPPPPAPAVKRRPPGRRPRALAPLVALALLLLGGAAAGAFLLPGATIRIAPVTQPIGPFAYELETGADLELHVESGEEPASVSGTATGIREASEAAVGVVELRNWNTVAIEVAAGTQVAAGEVVFTTDAPVVVPRGHLTPQGTIAAGTASVGVHAAVAGPGGNVEAGTIDTMLTEPTNTLLHGFSGTPDVVENPEATAGGITNEIPVIEQADVDAALATLRSQLDTAVAEARVDAAARLYLDPAEGEIAVDVEVPDDLVGREGETAFELAGTLRWTLHWLDREELDALARERLSGDPAATVEGRELVPDATVVTIGTPVRDGDAARIPVQVTGATSPTIDDDAVRALVAGMTREEAIAALAGIGPASVDLWPGWVDRVPGLTWRISIEAGSAVEPRPSASGSAGP